MRKRVANELLSSSFDRKLAFFKFSSFYKINTYDHEGIPPYKSIF
jgi:hypothetical protein